MVTEQQAKTAAANGHHARPSPASKQPPASSSSLLKLTAAGLLLGGLTGLALADRNATPSRASRLAAGGAALLAASVLADSAMEHYRGNYKKPAMHVAPVMAAITFAAAIAATFSRRASSLKNTIFGGAIVTGLFGLGFHIKNIFERPGGMSFNNLFYRAPFGAPGALILAGLAGLGAINARDAGDRNAAESHTKTLNTGRFLGAVTALGLFGLTTEVGLLHFRGAFHNKLMYAPVAALPLTGVAMAMTTARTSPQRSDLTRNALMTTMALGIMGTGLHAYGVNRNMGGFRNWTQNLFQGPPIAAPPSLAGIGLIGLSALKLFAHKSEGR